MKEACRFSQYDRHDTPARLKSVLGGHNLSFASGSKVLRVTENPELNKEDIRLPCPNASFVAKNYLCNLQNLIPITSFELFHKDATESQDDSKPERLLPN